MSWWSKLAGWVSGTQASTQSPVPVAAACLRGLKRKDWVKGTSVQSAAFVADDKKALAARLAEGHQPPGWEVSINWEDDETVAAFTQRQPNAQFGLARLRTEAVLQSNAATQSRDATTVERRAIPGNPFHGNLVFAESLEPWVQKLLAATLALHSEFVPPPST